MEFAHIEKKSFSSMLQFQINTWIGSRIIDKMGMKHGAALRVKVIVKGSLFAIPLCEVLPESGNI
jgi:hypothetical protein